MVIIYPVVVKVNKARIFFFLGGFTQQIYYLICLQNCNSNWSWEVSYQLYWLVMAMKALTRGLQSSNWQVCGECFCPQKTRLSIINYRFLTTEKNFKAICSDCTDFCLQIFVYSCVFRKKEKQRSQNLSYFENESTFRKRTTFWKWKKGSGSIV